MIFIHSLSTSESQVWKWYRTLCQDKNSVSIYDWHCDSTQVKKDIFCTSCARFFKLHNIQEIDQSEGFFYFFTIFYEILIIFWCTEIYLQPQLLKIYVLTFFSVKAKKWRFLENVSVFGPSSWTFDFEFLRNMYHTSNIYVFTFS